MPRKMILKNLSMPDLLRYRENQAAKAGYNDNGSTRAYILWTEACNEVERRKNKGRTNPPKGYRVRLGTGIGNGRYSALIVADDGFRFSPEVANRQEAITRAWAYFDARLAVVNP